MTNTLNTLKTILFLLAFLERRLLALSDARLTSYEAHLSAAARHERDAEEDRQEAARASRLAARINDLMA